MRKIFNALVKGRLRFGVFVLFVVLAAFAVSKFYYQIMLIQGDSMNPSYYNMQFTILDKWHRDYSRGDVIAFRCDGLGEVLVKRIAAVPGDAIQIIDGTLYVNGFVSAVYPQEKIFSYAGIAANEIKLSDGQYFVIGDNIEMSKDSRYEVVGVVGEDAVIGKVVL